MHRGEQAQALAVEPKQLDQPRLLAPRVDQAARYLTPPDDISDPHARPERLSQNLQLFRVRPAPPTRHTADHLHATSRTSTRMTSLSPEHFPHRPPSSKMTSIPATAGRARRPAEHAYVQQTTGVVAKWPAGRVCWMLRPGCERHSDFTSRRNLSEYRRTRCGPAPYNPQRLGNARHRHFPPERMPRYPQ